MDDLVMLTKTQVPDYLVGSDFHNSLSADDEEEFSIPRKFLKLTANVTSGAELAHLFHTMKFWGVIRLPSNIIELLIFKSGVIPNCEEGPIKAVLVEFDAEFKLSQLHETLPICCTKKQRLDSAAQCGREDVLEHVMRVDGQVNTVVIKAAAEHGFFQLLQRVVGDFRQKSNQCPFSKVSTVTVASRGHAECLLYVLENGCKKEKFTCRVAAENGHLSCLKVAREHGCAWNQGVVDAAVINRHLNCLIYAMEYSNAEKVADTASLAAEHDQVECLRYLLDHGVEPTRRMCNAACVHDSLACLQLLRARGAPWDVVTARKAAERGSLVCLRYLFDEGCKIDGSVALAAARAGCDQSLHLLLTLGCAVDGTSVDAAAKRGHSGCVQVLKAFGILLEEGLVYETFDHDNSVDSADEAEFATIGGGGGRYDYELYIRALHEAGYAIPQCALKQAVIYGHGECLEYICTNKCCELTADLTSAACACTNDTYSVVILEILHRHGCPWDEETCTQAARVCNVEALAFAHEHGCPWNADTSSAAIRLSGTACLQYTLDHGCPVDDGACAMAARRGLHVMLQMLHEHGCPLTLKTCIAAATYKYPDCLTYVVTHGAPVDGTVCAAAGATSSEAYDFYMSLYASVDPLSMLKCAHNLGCPWDERTCAAAAASNCCLECLRYAHENGCAWDATSTTAAIHRYGCDCLAYALSHGCPVAEDACVLAARRGLADILQLLHEHACALTLETCIAAATHKYISCLTYAMTHGAPVDATVCVAALADHEPVPGPYNYNTYLQVVPLEMLRCARNLGCPWDKRVSQAAAAKGDASCLRYCVENGCPIDKATMQKYNSL